MVTTEMVLTGFGADHVQLFRLLEAHLGERLVKVPYWLRAGASPDLMTQMRGNLHIGEEIQVVLDDQCADRYGMRLVKFGIAN